MKKTATLMMGIMPALFLPACEKNAEASLKYGTYVLQNVERDIPGEFTITIYDDGTFQCYETPVSSYIGMGRYSIEKNIVTLKEDGDGCTGDINRYQIADDKLLFISDDSANYHFVPLEDGASFVWMSDIQ